MNKFLYYCATLSTILISTHIAACIPYHMTKALSAANSDLPPHTCIVAIPGQNGRKKNNIQHILPKQSLYHAETPLKLTDLGQHRCISYLKKTLRPLIDDPTITNIVLH